MKKAMIVTQWVLGILASLSLIVAIVYKFVYMITYTIISNASPMGFLWLSVACSLLSMALSLIKMGKFMEDSKK
ncbi:TPA: hypothetical protein ENS27_19575 [bacterium]|nr:hypothetical protein [bacterium]